MKQFAKALEYYWDMRLKVCFPEKKFAFLPGMDLFDENGLCLTLYEDLS